MTIPRGWSVCKSETALSQFRVTLACHDVRREAMPLPIVCELTAETAKTRRAALVPALVSRAERREETEDGYRLTFWRIKRNALRATADTVTVPVRPTKLRRVS
jgi:hypothetical protein